MFELLVIRKIVLTLWCNQNIKCMSSVKVMKTITSENRPSFNEWCQDLKVSSGYVEPNRREPILRQTIKSKDDPTFWESLFKVLGL